MDFAAERKKRRDEADQRALAARTVAALAANHASEVVRALNADLNKGRTESVQVTLEDRTISLRNGAEYLRIIVTDELKYDLKYTYGRTISFEDPPDDQADFANNEAELAAKVDRWRGLPD